MIRLVCQGEEIIIPSKDIVDRLQRESIVFIPMLSRFAENGIFGRVIPYGQFGIYVN